MFRKTLAAAAGACCLVAINVQAQTMSAKFPTNTKTVWLHTAMPTGCDSPLVRAVNTWNAQPVNFNWQFDAAANLTGSRWYSGDSRYVIEDGTTSSASAHASTYRAATGTIGQVHTVVKAEHLWYNNDESGGRFYCSATAGTTPSTKYDYQTTMTHELGHALGMDDGGASTCVMYGYQGMGTAGQRRSLCSTEATSFKNAYGAG